MKIQTKVSLLIFSIALIFIIGIILFKISEGVKIENLFKEEEKEKIISFQKTIQSVGKSLEVLAYDYTIWNEMVRFIKTNDTVWANENIGIALTTYNAQYVWIYQEDFKIFYSTDKLSLSELPLPKEKFVQMFKDSLFCYFFIIVDEGLLEIRGAPIQPGNDFKRETKPYGYFFAGRLWTEKFLSEISIQISSKVNLESVAHSPMLNPESRRGIQLNDKISEQNNNLDKNFKVTASVDLPGWDGKPVMRVVTTSDLPTLRNLDEFVKNQILYSLIFSVLILVIVSIFLIKAVSNPLKIISQSLKEKNPALLRSLSKNKAEFGKVSSLIIQFFKITESSLKKSEEKYRRIFENVQDIIFQMDSKGVLTSISPSAERYSEFKPEEIIGRSMKDFYYDPADAEKLFEELHKKGEVTNFETIILSKSGKLVPFLINTRLIYDNNRKIIGYEGTARDISELKLKEEKIKKFSYAIEQSPVSVVITNTSGDIEYINSKFTQVSGYTFEEVYGRNTRILKSGLIPSELYKNLWTTINSGNEWKGELLNKKKNGDLYWELVLISPIKNANNVITNYMAIKEDITEKKKNENELRAAKEKAEEMNRLKSSFLANMSHELRTPLNGILGFSEILSSEINKTEWKEMIDTIRVGGQRLLETLNQILDISKFESEKVVVNYETVKVEELINESTNLLRPVAQKKNLFLKVNVPETGVTVVLDRNLLYSVLTNLIGNAIKYTQQGGVTVELSLESLNAKSFVVIKVSDTGIGIPKEYHHTIFEEFRQVSEGFNRKFEGSGLGLSITKRIVEKFNGEIFVESETGIGSTFTVKIPVATAGTITGEDIKEPTSGTQILHVETEYNRVLLYVDDDDSSRRIVKTFLKNSFIVETADDRITALEQIGKRKYSLVLLDINLGGGDSGIEILKEIRKRDDYKDVAVIAVTAYAMSEERDRILNEGFTDYIPKPFSKKVLTEVIRKYKPVRDSLEFDENFEQLGSIKD